MRVQRLWPMLWMTLWLAAGCAKDGERSEEKPDMQRGMRAYRAYCQECHDTGVGGAPKLDDIDEWDERAFVWKDVQKDHAAQGFVGMPAKGSHPQLTERELKDALYYMNIKIRAEGN